MILLKRTVDIVVTYLQAHAFDNLCRTEKMNQRIPKKCSPLTSDLHKKFPPLTIAMTRKKGK